MHAESAIPKEVKVRKHFLHDIPTEGVIERVTNELAQDEQILTVVGGKQRPDLLTVMGIVSYAYVIPMHDPIITCILVATNQHVYRVFLLTDFTVSHVEKTQWSKVDYLDWLESEREEGKRVLCFVPQNDAVNQTFLEVNHRDTEIFLMEVREKVNYINGKTDSEIRASLAVEEKKFWKMHWGVQALMLAAGVWLLYTIFR
ncbi:MAG: hypothetical protein ACRC5C_04165 [Bacilli bacterium]